MFVFNNFTTRNCECSKFCLNSVASSINWWSIWSFALNGRLSMIATDLNKKSKLIPVMIVGL